MKKMKKALWAVVAALAAVFICLSGSSAKADGETVTITFNYGFFESAMQESDYVYNDIQYAHTVTVEKGGPITSEDTILYPGDTIGEKYLSGWSDADGYEVYLDDAFYEDTVLYADYYYEAIYHAGAGTFYNGSDTYTKRSSFNGDNVLDVSLCCYPNSNDKAFVGWALKEDATEDDVLPDYLEILQNKDLYAVYVDGYSLTFDANLDGAYIPSYYESYRDSDGGINYGTYRSCGNKTLTLTYPIGKKPYEANYFCGNPMYNDPNPGSNDDVIFKCWALDKDGEETGYFENYTPKGDGTDALYAIWDEFWTVTFDSNRGEGYYSTTTTRQVIKGQGVSTPSYSTFDYYTDDASKSCIGFNTKPDGSGATVNSSFIPESDITVYALYKDTYTVTLDANGGYFYNSYYNSYSVDQGEEFKGDFSDRVVIWPVEEGEEVSRKVVKEFNTLADGSGVTPPFTPTKNTTLYAIPEDGVLITFDTNAQDGDEGNQYGTIFNFRGSGNVTEAAFAYSTKRAMMSVPYINYLNDSTKMFAGWSTVYGDTSHIINPNTFIPKEDMTLYATWYDLVEIRYHANGGAFSYSYEGDDEGFSTSNVIKGKKFTPYEMETPSLSGSIFVGWAEIDGSSNAVPYGKTYVTNTTMDFYAVWETGYTITIDGNGGSIHYISPDGHETHGDPEKAVFTIKKGDTVFDPSFSYSSSGSGFGQIDGWRDDNYVIAGFSKTKNGELIDLEKYVPEKDETFFTIWEKPCVVTYDPNGGEMSEYSMTDYVAKGHTVYWTPDPTLEGEYFAGWYLNYGTAAETVFNTNTIVTSDITVTAKWVSEFVTLSFDAGAGATFYHDHSYVQKADIEVAEGSDFDLSSIWPSRTDDTDKSFGGWTSENYTWELDTSEQFYTATEDTAFKAIWKDTPYYIITFDGNGGLVDANNIIEEAKEKVEIKVKYGQGIYDYVYAYMKDSTDMEFTGWYLDKECTDLYLTAARTSHYYPDEDITLYAGWQKKSVAVTGISLSIERVTIGVSDDYADTYQLKAIVYPSTATNNKVTFTSSNPEIATIDEAGVITAVSVGTTTITAVTSDGGFKATCEVEVVTTTTKSINVALDNLTADLDGIEDSAAAKEAVQNALSELGGAARLKELISSNPETAQKLEDLEAAYTAKAGITVKDADTDSNRSTLKQVLGLTDDAIDGTLEVTGAGLSGDPGDTLSLSIKEVNEKDKNTIDKKYTNDKQLDISLEKANGSEITDVSSPVTFTLPIPQGMIRSKLYILHFNSDGTYELIRPVFKNNSMKITVSHFSHFAIVELADGTVSEPDNPTPTPTSAPANPSVTPTAAPGTPSVTPTAAPTDPSVTPTANPSVTPTAAPGTPNVTPTAAPSASAVKDGATVSETGSTATYKVTSAANKTVAYTGDAKAKGKVTIKSTIKVGNDTFTVTSIGSGAFKKNKNITAVVIPSTVESIGKSAFEGCVKLKTVTIKGTKLKTIGDSAFKGCSVLSKFTVPKSVTKVGKQAFMNCKKLKTITVKSKKTKFMKNALKKVPSSAKLKLPKMTAKEKTAYKKMLKKTAVYKGKYK